MVAAEEQEGLRQAHGNAKRENLLLLASCCQEGDHKLGRVPKLLERMTPFAHGNLDAIHEEVNELKHSLDGVGAGRQVTFAMATAGLSELLDLIESRVEESAGKI